MNNYVYAAGFIRYISLSQTAFLLECDNSLIPVRYGDGNFDIRDQVIVEGTLRNDCVVFADRIEKHEDKYMEPVSLAVFDGRIGKGKKHSMLVTIGPDFIKPEHIATRSPGKNKLDKRKLRLIVARFTIGMRLDILQAAEL